jgi:aspartate dehydrogenase
MPLVDLARETGARIIVPTGALLGLDAVRATAEGHISSVRIVTRKPPAGLAGAPLLVKQGLSVDGLQGALARIRRQRREAIKAFQPTSTWRSPCRWPASAPTARRSRSGPIRA